MRSLQLVAVATALSFFTLGCGSSTGPTPPVISGLTCQQPSGEFSECQLGLQQAGGFSITLDSIRTCAAIDDVIRITQPVDSTLSTDGCHAPTPTTWTINGPFPAGTTVAMEMRSRKRKFPTGLHVTGDYPQWTINFEDGGDQDFNDLDLTVKALPF